MNDECYYTKHHEDYGKEQDIIFALKEFIIYIF